MKLSFDFGESDYIGSFLDEYKKAGFYKDISVEEALQRRSDSITIDHKNTGLYKFILKLSEEKGDLKKDGNFRKIIEDISNFKFKRISKSEYTEIEKILREQYPEIKKEYVDDFALFVIYAKKKCFKEQKVLFEKWEKLFSKELRDEIKHFYSDIYDKKVSVNSITVSYIKEEADKCMKRHKLVIDSSVLMKIMLYQFAKKYFTVFEKKDEENWEQNIKNYDIIEKKKGGRSKNFDTGTIKSILQLYWLFTKNEGILEDDTLEDGGIYKKYGLIGKLLSIVGYKNPDDHQGYGYKGKDDFYYKRLIKLWIPEGTK